MTANTGRRIGTVIQQVAALVLVLVAVAPAQAQTETVEYYALDAIGSVRVVFDANGNVLGRMDYGPYGEPLSSAAGLPSRAYAGLFRDGEAGLDYAQARMYQRRSGRLNAPDPIFSGLFEPQRWNRYTYALNSPIVYTDATGLQADACETTFCVDVKADPFRALWSWGWSWGGFGGGSSDGGHADWEDLGGGSGPGVPTPPVVTPPATPPTAPPGPGPTPPDPTEETEVIVEFIKGCGQGAAGFVDGVIPFADPLQTAGAYGPTEPAAWFSQPIGSNVRDFAVAEFSAGAMLGRTAKWLYTAAKGGNQTARTVSSGNRYVRLGMSRMGGGLTPGLRFGNARTEWGRWLTHVDLRLTQGFSQTAPPVVKRIQGCLR